MMAKKIRILAAAGISKKRFSDKKPTITRNRKASTILAMAAIW
jgi:hypothetical protein